MQENPYEPPATQARPSPLRRQTRLRTIGAILVLLAMLPAAGIACFTICIVVGESVPRGANDRYGVGQLMTGMLVGLVGGVVVFGLMLWWGVALSRPFVEKQREWIKSDGAKFEAFFVSKDRENVTLRMSDGTQMQMPKYQLCDRDREWLEMQT